VSHSPWPPSALSTARPNTYPKNSARGSAPGPATSHASVTAVHGRARSSASSAAAWGPSSAATAQPAASDSSSAWTAQNGTRGARAPPPPPNKAPPRAPPAGQRGGVCFWPPCSPERPLLQEPRATVAMRRATQGRTLGCREAQVGVGDARGLVRKPQEAVDHVLPAAALVGAAARALGRARRRLRCPRLPLGRQRSCLQSGS
jgi:hypothetical protein